MRFIDEAVIDISSGRGGAGSVHFRREKFAPKMGPDGGDGGRGGSIFFEASTNLQSLLDFKFTSKYAAEDGKPGEGKDCNGCGGEDLVINVPVGTVVRDAQNGQFLCDLIEPGVRVLVLRGGRGGLGNMNFATSVRQAPDFAQPGEPGQERTVKLELKLLADVALVGFPNAGKSTLISRWSAARPKIADYPFTTLVPNLGVVRGKRLDFTLADVPGIIEGAHEGKGLGIQFLKHAERSRLLIILLDLDPNHGRDLCDEYKILESEIEEFSPDLAQRPRIVVVNKTDAFGPDPQDELFQEFLKERGFEELKKYLASRDIEQPSLISAVSGYGLDDLKTRVENRLAQIGPRTFVTEVAPSLNLGADELFGDRKNADEATQEDAEYGDEDLGTFDNDTGDEITDEFSDEFTDEFADDLDVGANSETK